MRNPSEDRGKYALEKQEIDSLFTKLMLSHQGVFSHHNFFHTFPVNSVAGFLSDKPLPQQRLR
jgi:hypothetical protein